MLMQNFGLGSFKSIRTGEGKGHDELYCVLMPYVYESYEIDQT